MNEDRTIYKDLRNTIDRYLNNGKFTIEYDNIDFNDDLKNSALRKTFIEFVTSNLNPDGQKEISNYDFFTNAYFSLDLLGISREPSKKVKFRNVINDGLHSYYGAFCNYVISDDHGFLKKTKALYRLLKIDTKVIHIEDFISYFSLLSMSFESSQLKFFELLRQDLKNGLITSSIPSIKSNRQTITIKPYHNYLGYFNQIDIVQEDNQSFVFLSRVTNNYSDFCFYREFEGIVNRFIKLFGIDKNMRSEYKWEEENNKIKLDQWEGRSWQFDDIDIVLEINKGTKELTLFINPNLPQK